MKYFASKNLILIGVLGALGIVAVALMMWVVPKKAPTAPVLQEETIEPGKLPQVGTFEKFVPRLDGRTVLLVDAETGSEKQLASLSDRQLFSCDGNSILEKLGTLKVLRSGALIIIYCGNETLAVYNKQGTELESFKDAPEYSIWADARSYSESEARIAYKFCSFDCWPLPQGAEAGAIYVKSTKDTGFGLEADTSFGKEFPFSEEMKQLAPHLPVSAQVLFADKIFVQDGPFIQGLTHLFELDPSVGIYRQVPLSNDFLKPLLIIPNENAIVGFTGTVIADSRELPQAPSKLIWQNIVTGESRVLLESETSLLIPATFWNGILYYLKENQLWAYAVADDREELIEQNIVSIQGHYWDYRLIVVFRDEAYWVFDIETRRITPLSRAGYGISIGL